MVQRGKSQYCERREEIEEEEDGKDKEDRRGERGRRKEKKIEKLFFFYSPNIHLSLDQMHSSGS